MQPTIVWWGFVVVIAVVVYKRVTNIARLQGQQAEIEQENFFNPAN